MTNVSWFDQDFPAFITEIPHLGKPLNSGQPGTVDHPTTFEEMSMVTLEWWLDRLRIKTVIHSEVFSKEIFHSDTVEGYNNNNNYSQQL